MKVKRLEHVAVAVTEINEAMRVLEDTLGLKVESDELSADGQNRVVMYPVGETYVELVQGMSSASITSKWIAEKGRGLWHLCFEVDDIDAALVELKANRVGLLTEEPIPGHANSRIAFLDPKDTANVLIELAELPRDHDP